MSGRNVLSRALRVELARRERRRGVRLRGDDERGERNDQQTHYITSI